MTKQLNDTFIDPHFRRWRIFNVVGDYYDCEFVEYLDGYINDTPRYKLFEKDEIDKGS